ncbi:MAG: thiamine pyrophosphate-binding protein [Myxococcales bacterium]
MAVPKTRSHDELTAPHGLSKFATQTPANDRESLTRGRRTGVIPQRRRAPAVETTVANAFLDILEAEGVTAIFGVPGGPLTGLFEAMHARKTIRFVLAKHEAGAAFMAAAHARITRTLAVCCATSGPGATNALTGIASAYTESLPVLMLTGQVARFVYGKGAIQESSIHGIDVVEMFRPVTKLSASLPEAGRGPDILRLAIRTAFSGRHGPVHLSMPADIISRPIKYEPLKPAEYRSMDARPVDTQAVADAVSALSTSTRPCILAGYGVSCSKAFDELMQLACTLGAPVATSPKGKGAFPENHPLSLGVLGFGGQGKVEELLASGAADALVIVGSSMNEFVTNAWTLKLHPDTVCIHIDIDAGSIGKNYPVDVAVVGDARATLHELTAGLALSERAPVEENWHRLEAPDLRTVATPVAHEQSPLRAQAVMKELRDAMSDDTMLFVDNGNSILWGTHYFEARKPDTYFIDLGLSCMGSAVAGVVGAAMAAPKRRAVALVGDGAFAMTGWEVHTAVEQRLPIVWVVLNNGGHGMVHHGDKLMKGKDLGVALYNVPIDCAAMACAMGARGVRATSVSEFRRALTEALQSDGPVLIDAVVDPSEAPPTLVRRVQTLAQFFASVDAAKR